MRTVFRILMAALLVGVASVSYADPNPMPVPDLEKIIPGWEQTPATGMRDVAIARSGRIWLAGKNGTVWSSSQGVSFEEESGVSGFGRIAAGDIDGNVAAVGSDNHTLWLRSSTGRVAHWFQTPASDVADIALDGDTVWIAGTNGTIWFSESGTLFRYTIEGMKFKQIKADGFCRVAAGGQLLWAVGCNGTLWHYKRNYLPNSAWDAGTWVKTDASGIGDVTVDQDGSLWLIGLNGSVWKSGNGRDFDRISPPAGFVSIAAGHGKVYAVHADGTLWRYVGKQ